MGGHSIESLFPVLFVWHLLKMYTGGLLPASCVLISLSHSLIVAFRKMLDMFDEQK